MPDRLTPDYNKRNEVKQPHFTRQRAPYRAPLISERLNLEAEQIRFDLTNLRAMLNQFQADLEEQLTLFTDGEVARKADNGATPSNQTVGVLDDLFALVELYEERVRRLEIKQGLRT